MSDAPKKRSTLTPRQQRIIVKALLQVLKPLAEKMKKQETELQTLQARVLELEATAATHVEKVVER